MLFLLQGYFIYFNYYALLILNFILYVLLFLVYLFLLLDPYCKSSTLLIWTKNQCGICGIIAKKHNVFVREFRYPTRSVSNACESPQWSALTLGYFGTLWPSGETLP